MHRHTKEKVGSTGNRFWTEGLNLDLW